MLCMCLCSHNVGGVLYEFSCMSCGEHSILLASVPDLPCLRVHLNYAEERKHARIARKQGRPRTKASILY